MPRFVLFELCLQLSKDNLILHFEDLHLNYKSSGSDSKEGQFESKV